MFCVYLLAAGGGIAYAGSSGRVEERLRRHFRGYSSAAGRGLRPDAAYVLACTRSRSLAFAWETWLHKAYRPPYAARAPAKRPRKPPHPPPGWYIPQAAVYEPARPPPGRYRPPHPPPKLKPRAKTWDGVRDGGPQEPRDVDLGGFVHTAQPPGSAPPLGHIICRPRLADISLQEWTCESVPVGKYLCAGAAAVCEGG
jgi:predicted GIY-YIG superfamily endonuclease